MAKVQRECCDYCMWYGPIKADKTMRKHFVAGDNTGGRRRQVKESGVCEGSGKPFARFGAEPTSNIKPCGKKLLRLSGGFTTCTKPEGHDKAHSA